MKQILIRNPSADVILKRVGDIGYIFITPKTEIGTVIIDGIPEWFRMDENEIIGFYTPSTESDGRYLGSIQYRTVFDKTTGEFVEGQIKLNATGWIPLLSCSLVVNMNDQVIGEEE